MSKPFKQLRGRTILLDVPKRKESAIQLSVKDEDMIMQEAVKMWNKLTVYAVGDKVEEVKEGDQVYVRTSALNMETVERIDIDGEVKLVLNEVDVVMVWQTYFPTEVKKYYTKDQELQKPLIYLQD